MIYYLLAQKGCHHGQDIKWLGLSSIDVENMHVLYLQTCAKFIFFLSIE